MSYSDEDDHEERTKKERSPSFPFISLPRAIDRAKAVSVAHRRNPARPATIGETWGYGPSSSGLLQTISALKAYGLLEDMGRGADRRIQLTDLAQKILHDARPGAREAAIREAAVLPRLFAEYAAKWVPQRPSDRHCLSELRLDRGFTEIAAKTFLRSFDETMIFASLSLEDNGSADDEKVLEEERAEAPPMTGLNIVSPRAFQSFPSGSSQFHARNETRYAIGPTGHQGPTGHKGTGPTGASGLGDALRYGAHSPRATLPLPEGIAAIEIPSSLSRKSYEALKAWTETMVLLAERNVSSKWYVEWYTPQSTKAEECYLLPDWRAVKKLMADFKKETPEVIFRVIGPDDAPEEDLAELRASGVRTF